MKARATSSGTSAAGTRKNIGTRMGSVGRTVPEPSSNSTLASTAYETISRVISPSDGIPPRGLSNGA